MRNFDQTITLAEGAPSDRSRANRVAAGRKAATAGKAKLARRNAHYGPEGSARGSAPVRFSIATLLRRIREKTEGT